MKQSSKKQELGTAALYCRLSRDDCFACGEHGDVIDFAAKLFGLPLYAAAQRLAADFHLTPDKPPSAAALHAKRVQTKAQQLRENERLCVSVLSDYSDLQAQAAELNPVELYAARQAIRPTQEKAAEQQLEDAMHEKPSLIMLLSARQETSRLLGEDVEERQARQMVMQRQKEQRLVPQNQSKKKEHWER